MELDTKQKVLIALFTEYQKDLPNMRSIKAETLGLQRDVFNVAISKLVTEGYITDALEIRLPGETYPAYRLDDCKLTRDGIDYVQNKLEIEPTLSGVEKIKGVVEKLGQWGLEQVKEVVVKIASETIKGSIGGGA
ncbi:YjcQ family protein [Aneurinibacillus migulanus]|uniref:YjcQ family protein n=1 Tax=Aneurinibacillus migulanus TaxID=47500 RepID=UPI00209EA53A|nr:hypothetical protein [Aneurinibacillus migulanus]MCP1355454.1 hypothetical protein [Aneurinibacillus migulanus]